MSEIKEDTAVIPSLEEGVPKLFVKMADTYNAMLEDAEVQEEDGTVIWAGPLTTFLDEEVGIPVTQYSRVIGTLSKMGCIAQLVRGSGNISSKWAMIGPPTIEGYKHYRKKAGYAREKKANRVEQQLNDLRREVTLQRRRLDDLMSHLGVLQDKEQEQQHLAEIDQEMRSGKA